MLELEARRSLSASRSAGGCGSQGSALPELEAVVHAVRALGSSAAVGASRGRTRMRRAEQDCVPVGFCQADRVWVRQRPHTDLRCRRRSARRWWWLWWAVGRGPFSHNNGDLQARGVPVLPGAGLRR